MNNFPTELLQQIFILLEQDDQFQCMLVCHLWKNKIEEYCLFRRLQIYSPSILCAISKTTHEKPELLNNVERLTLHSYDADEKTLFSLMEALPNVRDFYYIGPLFQDLNNDYISQLPWYRSIEKIIVDSCHKIVDSMLLNNVCPNLSDLSVCCHDNDFVRFLKNTPKLEKLALYMGTIEFDDINEIHKLLPGLKVLKLRDKSIMGDIINNNITPAYSTTQFALNLIETTNMQMELELLRFIIKKYPNLEDLEFETHFKTENNEERDILHRLGWDPLFKNLAPTLRKLHTSYTCKIQNLLETLDRHKCQIDNLKIEYSAKMNFPNFAQSQQTLYIKTLILKDVKFETLEWIKDLTVLETLEIEMNRNELRYGNRFYYDFNDFIDYSPPTLKLLSLTCVALTSILVSAKQSNIKTLEFNHTRLPQEISSFIDRHFPLLSNLKINKCMHQIKEFTLKSAELDLFYYVNEEYDLVVHALVRTIYDGEERLYSTRGDQHLIRYQSYYEQYNGISHPPVKSQPVNNIKIKPHISLCCFKVNKVILHL